MAYTVRTDEQDDTIIQQAKDHLGEKSATKAMIEACKQVPRLDRERRRLLEELEGANRKYHILLRLVRDKISADTALLNAIKKD